MQRVLWSIQPSALGACVIRDSMLILPLVWSERHALRVLLELYSKFYVAALVAKTAKIVS